MKKRKVYLTPEEEKRRKKGKKSKKELLEYAEKLEEELKHKLGLEEEGLEVFFGSDQYTPAHPDEYEGHYPGNQDNTIVIPYSKGIKHVT